MALHSALSFCHSTLIYTLVTRSMEIDASRKGKKDKEPKAVKELRELADELEKDLPDVEDLAQKRITPL